MGPGECCAGSVCVTGEHDVIVDRSPPQTQQFVTHEMSLYPWVSERSLDMLSILAPCLPEPAQKEHIV